MRTRKLRGAWLVIATCAFSAGCNDFLEIKPGSCGNKITELERGEDCDGFERAGMFCRAQGDGDALACRFDCRRLDAKNQPMKDGSLDPSRCVQGWTCGGDGVCRASRGGFETVGIPLQESAVELIPGDFDGDTHMDVLSAGSGGINVHFLDEGGIHARSVHVPGSNARPAVGDMSGDGIADFTMSTSVGLGVQRGQTSRELEPVVFPVFEFEAVDGLRMLPVVLPEVLGIQRAENFILTKKEGKWWLTRPGATALALAGETITHTLVSPAAPAMLPCDKIAIAFADTPRVEVHAACDPLGLSANPSAQPLGFPRVVKLTSPGFTPRRFFFQDRNADGVPDLVISAVKGEPPTAFEVEVAFANADGSYAPAFPISTKSEMLAVGDLDGNADVDVVLGDGLYRDWWTGMSKPDVENKGERWTEAVIVDLDLNGQLDVVAASDRRPNLEFLSGYDVDPKSDPPPVFTRFAIPTVGGAERLTIGNFDGDLVPDVAFAEIPLSLIGGKRTERMLTVVFGEPYSTPVATAHVGRFDHGIEQMLPMYLPFDGVDASLELGVVALRPSPKNAAQIDAAISLLQGNSERLLQAAMIISDQPEGAPPDDPQETTRYEVTRSFVGSFDLSPSSTDKSADIAVIVFSNKPALGNTPELRFGKVEGDVRARFEDASAPAVLPELDASPVARLLIEGVVVKELVQGNTVDELVLSLPVKTGGLLGSSLHRAVPNGTGWELLELHKAEPGVVYVGLRAADIDRDTNIDIAAMRVTFETSDDPDPTYEPVVFWGNSGGTLGAPVALDLMKDVELCDASRPLLPSSLAVLETGVSPEDVEAAKRLNPWVQPDDDAIPDRAKEIVLIDPFGAYRITVEPTTRVFSAPSCLKDVPGGKVVVAADITGEGVDDLVIAAPGSTYLLKGIARRP
ncbi:FG-GAP repeat domain-containing protein [Polyangium aurulentum]|uniref:FG-GAP repeat domain-containing protein n=1 Tax=Polyangium aurulentum TaxID=2567896 RepID=UPI0010AE4828|nr:VCBS repeat-containing protein [Polyangium aurulentum]UQA56038.1 VCBS repeat-containing protein [Polyangium aurulentum]